MDMPIVPSWLTMSYVIGYNEMKWNENEMKWNEMKSLLHELLWHNYGNIYIYNIYSIYSAITAMVIIITSDI